MPYRQPPAEPASDLRCPRCRGDLRRQTVGPNRVERCPSCHGVWIAAAEFNQLLRDLDRREAVRLHERPHRMAEESIGYVACPRCGEVMARRNFGRTSGILVDTCKKHGIWLDRGELRRVVEHLAQCAPPDQPDLAPRAPARPQVAPPPVPAPVSAPSFLDALLDFLARSF